MELQQCTICPRQCGVPRTQKRHGFCGMPADPVLARAALHYGEEPCISGTCGSGTVFFSGCSLRCVFCQNFAISHERLGQPVTIERLAAIFRELEEAGAHNINLVNPTHFVPAIINALQLYRPSIPVVYNTGGYERVETIRQLNGFVDVYLPDLKYVSSDLAHHLSGASDYFEYASAAITEMIAQTGPVILNDEGTAQKGTMVRHLVLPGYTRESLRVLDWLAEHTAETAWISLMFQYTPIPQTLPKPPLDRPLTKRECQKVYDYMLQRGLTNGYVQERKSAGQAFIPAFDFTGVSTNEVTE